MMLALRILWSAVLLTAAASLASAEEVPAALRSSDEHLIRLRDELSRDVARKTDDAELWRDLGICQARTGLYEDALRSLSRSQRVDEKSDAWRDAYLAVATEALNPSAAAKLYTGLVEEFKDGAQLAARAKALTLMSTLRPILAEDAPEVAVLSPTDLGGNAPELSADLEAALRVGLRGAGLVAHVTDEVQEWLSLRGRSMSELEDESGRRRVGTALADRGIQVLVTSSYFLSDDGSVHVAVALLPVTSAGLSDAVTVQAMGAAGDEFAVLPAAIVAVTELTSAELADAATVRSQIPTDARAVTLLRQADEALADGDLGPAVMALREIARLDEQATAIAASVAGLGAIESELGNPVVSSLADPHPVVKLLEAEALRRHRTRRSFAEDDAFQ